MSHVLFTPVYIRGGSQSMSHALCTPVYTRGGHNPRAMYCTHLFTLQEEHNPQAMHCAHLFTHLSYVACVVRVTGSDQTSVVVRQVGDYEHSCCARDDHSSDVRQAARSASQLPSGYFGAMIGHC